MGETRLIRERYRLIELIGRGGMGEVWRAHDEELDRKVAVKCLKQLSPASDAQHLRVLRERFRREARVAAGLQHRGITVVHDFGADDGVLYLVMELLEGRTLAQLLRDGQGLALPLPDLVDIAEQVAGALAYTHAQGVVHRDLKPANILRLTDGTVKICDFGIARLSHDIGFTSRLTGTGLAMGTPHYMSPEQIAGVELDHRSDLYSFGCVLYELATGAPPFDLNDAWAVLVRHRSTPPDPPRDRRPELPEPMERLILDLLAKEPDDRPQDAAVIGKRLAAVRLQAGRRELPSWARGLTTGADSLGHRRPRPNRPDPAVLTGTWFARPDATAPPEPGRPADPAARHNAGLNLSRLGRWAEAVEVHRAVAAERERLLGPDHADTLASRYELGFRLGRLGRSAEALAEYERVAAARDRVLGPDHPETLAARQETAYVLGQLGRHQDAYQVYVTVLAVRERAMGPDHPDTLRCRHNLAYSLGRLGRLEESYETANEVCAARARVLGADARRHPGHPVRSRLRARPVGALGGGADRVPRGGQAAQGDPRRRPPRHPRRALRGRHLPRPARARRGGAGAVPGSGRRPGPGGRPGATPRRCAPGTASASTSAASAAGRRRWPRPVTCARSASGCWGPTTPTR